MNYRKMHGAGNCFVLLNNTDGTVREEQMSTLALDLCAKEKVDGLILAAASPAGGDSDFSMLFYNADGSRGEMCGNGARCAARFGYELGLAKDPQSIRIRTTAGLVTGRRITEDRYEVRLNDPSVADLHRPVVVDGCEYDCAYVELGRPGIPHALVELPPEEIQKSDRLRELGRALRYAPAFPKGANVTFFAFTGEDRVKAITFERGVEDFTLACGTGCGSLAVTLALKGRLRGNVLTISMPGGELSIRFTKKGGSVTDILLTGPTAYMD